MGTGLRWRLTAGAPRPASKPRLRHEIASPGGWCPRHRCKRGTPPSAARYLVIRRIATRHSIASSRFELFTCRTERAQRIRAHTSPWQHVGLEKIRLRSAIFDVSHVQVAFPRTVIGRGSDHLSPQKCGQACSKPTRVGCSGIGSQRVVRRQTINAFVPDSIRDR